MRGPITLFLLLLTFLCHSQPTPFITYTPRDGLVNARVRNAYQDSKGRMYFLTFSGLSVYNGVSFKNYTTRDGLGSNMINDILEIGDDSLLIATNSGFVLNLLTGNRIERFQLEQDTTPIINKFVMDLNGIIYATADYGLCRLDGNKLYKFDLPQLISDKPAYLGDLCDAGPYLIFATNELRHYQGLYLFDKESEAIINFIPNVTANSLLKDSTDRIFVLGNNQLSLIDNAELQQGRLSLQNANSIYSHSDQRILNVAFSSEGNWFFYPYNQLKLFLPEEKPIMIDLSALNRMGGVNSMMVDKEQILWICIDGGGIIKINKPQFTMRQLVDGSHPDTRIAHVTANSPYIWHHTYDGNIYFNSAGRFESLSENLSPSAVIIGLVNDTLYARDENTLYAAATTSKRKYFFNPIFRHHDSLYFTGPSLIFPGLGILAASTEGLIQLSHGKVSLVYPMNKIDLLEELLMDQEGCLWLIPRYSDVIRFGLSKGTKEDLTVYKVFPVRKWHISPRAAAFDNAGYLWIGTRDAGVYVCDIRDDTFKIVNHFDTKTGLTDNFITCLLLEPDGSMLAGSQSGLDRIIPIDDNQYQIENLTKRSNFFAFIQFIWVENNNRTYALTNTGYEIEVYPLHKAPSFNHPRLFVDEVRVNGSQTPPGKNVFNYRENNFTINISAPTFIDEKQVQYSYLLEGGMQSAWSEASPTLSTINLLNLRPGEYTLHLRAAFPSTFYRPAEAKYQFSIQPAWWQTTIARVAFILLALFVTGMTMYFFYKRKLERQRVILEKQRAVQEERTRISSDLHDDLGSGLSTIRFLAEKIKQSDEVIPKATLDRIQDTSDELTDKMNEIIWAMSEKHDTLQDLLSYTRSYIATYCDEHGLLCHLQFPRDIPNTFVNGQVRRNVLLVIKESLHNILKHAQSKNVHIDIRIDRHLRITIRDDGKGFEGLPTDQKSGHGIHNMRARILSLGGTFSMMNDNGTLLELSIPLDQGN